MPNFKKLSRQISGLLKSDDPDLIAYTSTTPTSTQVELTDDSDGLPSRVTTPSRSQLQLALADANFSLTADSYSVSVYSDTEPSSNAVYWVSRDKGNNKLRARLIRKELGAQGGFFKLLLQVE